MGNASARDWDPIIGKRFNPLETVNTHSTIWFEISSKIIVVIDNM